MSFDLPADIVARRCSRRNIRLDADAKAPSDTSSKTIDEMTRAIIAIACCLDASRREKRGGTLLTQDLPPVHVASY